MLQDLVDRPGERAPAELASAYRDALGAIVEEAGPEAVADAVDGLDGDALASLVKGEAVEMTLEEAAAILAVREDIPADALAAEARDELLLGMTTAVLDVDTIAANLDGLSAKEVQQRVEGRAEMTLAEFAGLQSFIASRQR